MNGKPHPPVRFYAISAVFNDRVYTFGGQTRPSMTEQPELLSDMYMLMTHNYEWKGIRSPGATPPPVTMHSGNAIGSKWIVFGGKVAERVVNDIWVLDSGMSERHLRTTQRVRELVTQCSSCLGVRV